MSRTAMMRMRGGRFLVLGRAGLDLFADPPGARIEEAERFLPALGGSAAHIAAGIARLGGKVSLIGAVSDDAVGGYVRRQLHAGGVGIEHLRAVGGESRGSLSLIETREEPQPVYYRNGAAHLLLTPEHLAHVDWDSHDALVVSGAAFAGEPSRAAAFSALMRARSAGLALILDLDRRAEDWNGVEDAAETLKRAARGCDIVVGDEQEFSALADGDAVEFACALVGAPAQVVVFKKGAKGAFVFVENETFYTPIHSGRPLSASGGGDAFLAAFAWSLAQGRSYRDSAALGASAAAIVASRADGPPTLPMAEELEIFLKAHPALQVIES